jgi:endonuclease YncB( thermonuclease family)
MCRSHMLPLLAGVLLVVAAGCDVVRKPTPPPPAPVERVPLWQAAAHGDLALVQARVGEGADVTAADDQGLTALHYAARQGRVDILRFLLLQQAPLDVRDHRSATPLHLAAREGQLAAVQALVEAGADVLVRDEESYTPHGRAVLAQHLPVADYLAARGGAPVVEEVAVAAPAEVPTSVWLTGANFRVWTSLSGARLEAEFVQAQFDTVQLRKRDASLVRIRLAQLKPEDQMLARQLAGSAPPRLTRTRGPRPPTASSFDSLGLRIGKGKPWQVLANCKLLAREANDGDSFHVRHDGKEYIFRLYYVDAPETSLQFPDRVQEQAEYFSFSEQDALRVGEAAKHFTTRILAASPFTVVTQWEDARGSSQLPRYYAFVVTEQGDLDELLTAEGLVRVYGMHVADNLGGRKQSELRQLEQSARREGEGAWGMEKHARGKP